MPSVDYIVCKLPRFPFDKFNQADHQLTTQMKATGEVMSLGTNFEEALLKAIRGLEIGLVHLHHPRYESMSTEELCESIKVPTDDRLLKIAELFRHKVDLLQINQVTQIDNFFLDKILHIISLEQKLQEDPSLDNLKLAKKFGFSDQALQPYFSQDIRTLRKENKIVPVYKMIDGCAGEFNNPVNYYYSTYQRENESIVTNKESIVVIGSGPIRIGQGVEFDYSCVHAIWAIQEAGYEAIVINNNPETVSTDYSLCDKLYFEPLTLEDILNILDLEKPKGVIVTLGGQTPINLAKSLEEHHIPIIGTSPTSIEWAENRDSFEKIVSGCGIPQPSGKGVTRIEDGLKVANEIGYPCLVRPSYVLGGRAMQIVNNDTQLIQYLESAVKINENEPVLVDKYINGIEVEVDALCDTHEVFIPGLMQLIEATGIHSGDSISVYPPYSLSETVIETIKHYTTQLGLALQIKGLFNIQFIVDKEEKVYIIEVNPRSSRSVPFLSKVTGINLANLATKIMLGYKISELNIQENTPTMTYVKAPTFSFSKLSGLDAMLSPEMKSTGEAIGYDPSLNRALYKALQASHMKVVNYGTMFVTIADKDKQQALPLVKRFYDLGFNIEATKGTAQFLKDHQIKTKTKLKLSQGSNEIIESIRKGHITYIINTLSNSDNTSKDGYQIRRAAVENNITMFTSLDTLNVLLNVLEEMTIGVSPINGGQA